MMKFPVFPSEYPKSVQLLFRERKPPSQSLAVVPFTTCQLNEFRVMAFLIGFIVTKTKETEVLSLRGNEILYS